MSVQVSKDVWAKLARMADLAENETAGIEYGELLEEVVPEFMGLINKLVLAKVLVAEIHLSADSPLPKDYEHLWFNAEEAYDNGAITLVCKEWAGGLPRKQDK